MLALVRVIVILAACFASRWSTFYYCPQRFDNYVGILVWALPWLSLSLSMSLRLFKGTGAWMWLFFEGRRYGHVFSFRVLYGASKLLAEWVFFSSLVQWAWCLYKMVVESLRSSPLDPRLIGWCSHHFLKLQRSNNCKLSWRISNGCIQKQAVSGCPYQVCLYPKPYSLCPKLVNLMMPLLCKAGCKLQQNTWKKWCRLYRGIRWRFLVARSVMFT